jgi:hypothetical protein
MKSGETREDDGRKFPRNPGRRVSVVEKDVLVRIPRKCTHILATGYAPNRAYSTLEIAATYGDSDGTPL